MEWKCNKCGFWVTAENGKFPLYCPNCGRKLIETNEDNLNKQNLYPEKKVSSSINQCEKEELICPICCSRIETNDKSIICPDCNVAYHEECWQENQGCATYGCQSAPQTVNTNKKCNQSNLCPWCNAPVEQGSIICSSCGHIIDKSHNKKFDTGKIQDVIKTINNRLKLLQNDINIKFERIKPKIRRILSYYGYSLCNFIKFTGCDGRKQFASYIFVSFIIGIILLSFQNKKIFNLYLIFSFCPTVSGIIRRLHDIKLSPWYLFSGPLLLFLLFVPSIKQNKENCKEK